MKWKPIARLKEAEFEAAIMHNRLMVYNGCNGPYHCRMSEYPFIEALLGEGDGMWTHFLVLPEGPATRAA